VKKLIGFVIIVGIISGVWFKYSSYVKKAKEGVQGKPERTVVKFLEISENWSNILWKEKERKKIMKIKALMKEMKEVNKEDKEKINKIKEELASFGLEDPSYLFKNKNYGMSALNTFALYEFGGYKVGKTEEIEKNKAGVEVEFYALDFIGLGSLAEKLTNKKQRRGATENIYFHLEKKRYKWYIVKIEGQIGSLIDAVYNYRKYR